MSIKISDIYCKHLWKFEPKYKFKDKIIFTPPHVILNVRDTIHYNALINNDFSDYEKLLNTTNQPEHSLENFKKLINTFDIQKIEKLELIHDKVLNKYIVTDGVHRLSILLYNNFFENNLIPLELLNITYDNKSISYLSECLIRTTLTKVSYNGWDNRRTKHGYHSFNISNINLTGQRNPRKRLNIIKKHVDFRDKIVVDFGCNCGGMLFHIPEIKEGYGYDYDEKCISEAKNISSFFKYSNKLSFKKQDLNDITKLHSELPQMVDITFLLSLGSWIKNWRYLYELALKKSKLIIFETNNDKEGGPQLNFFREKNTIITLISPDSRDDMTGNYGRKTYLIVLKINNKII